MPQAFMNNNQTEHNGSNARLQALLGRKAALDAALRAEKEKRKALECRRHERLCNVVGRALLKQAARQPDFGRKLTSLLQAAAATLDESDRKFLEANKQFALSEEGSWESSELK
jgi:hypothetical protein